MSAAAIVQNLLVNGGNTSAKIIELDASASQGRSRFSRGNFEQMNAFPGIQINEFMVSADCKDGSVRDEYTVTVIAWAKNLSECDQLIDAVRLDIDRFRGSILTYSVSGTKFMTKGPGLRDKKKQLWGMPAEFEMYLH